MAAFDTDLTAVRVRDCTARGLWRDETVERYLDDLQAYWTESHRHTKRGGKTMYRS